MPGKAAEPRRRRARGLALVVLVSGCVESSRGCVSGWQSEEEQITFSDPTVIVGAEGFFENQAPLLVGTVLCPRIDCVRPEVEDEDNPPIDLCPANADESKTNQTLLQCFDMELEGLATLSGQCVTFTDAGAVQWKFTPRPCEPNALGFAPVPDAVTFEVVGPEQLSGWFRPEADLWALANLQPMSGQSFPEDAVRRRGDPVKLIADRVVRLPIVLEGPDQDVAWQVRLPDALGAAEVASIHVEALAGPAPAVELTPEGAVVTSLAAGARASLRLITPLVELDLGELHGVAASDIESLELIVGFQPASATVPAAPAGARAVLRDGAGMPVYGGRIAWEVIEGRLGLDRSRLSPEGQADPDAPDCEYMALAGDCYEQPYRDYEVRATLAARFGELEDTADIRWVIAPGESGFYDEFATLFGGGDGGGPGETTYPCEGPGALDCACRADGGRLGAWPTLGLLLLSLRRRRMTAVRAGGKRSA